MRCQIDRLPHPHIAELILRRDKECYNRASLTLQQTCATGGGALGRDCCCLHLRSRRTDLIGAQKQALSQRCHGCRLVAT